MQGRSITRDLPKMHNDRRGAQHITSARERRPGSVKGNLQQDGGQKAEHGETRRYHQVQERRGQSGPGQDDQRSQVPSQGKARRKRRQVAPLHAGPSPPAEQKRQENAEDQGAGRMPENIYQQRLVQAQHRTCPFRRHPLARAPSTVWDRLSYCTSRKRVLRGCAAGNGRGLKARTAREKVNAGRRRSKPDSSTDGASRWTQAPGGRNSR